MSSHNDPNLPRALPYETTDADTKQITVWTASIFITMAAGMLAMAALLFGFIKFPPALDRTPTDAEYQRSLPPAPRLQVNEPIDLQQFREREEQVLTTYGREPNSGSVRIPVDKAIDIVAARGVLPGAPKVAAAPAPAAGKQ
jgi:hypothetical protein